MKPKYQQVKDYIKDQITSEKLLPGDKVMSETELIQVLDVSRHTVRKALNELSMEQVIETFKGKGSFIKDMSLDKRSHNRQSKVIALVTAFINDTIFPELMNGLEQVLSEEGYSIMLYTTRNRVDSEREILQKIYEMDLAGVIVEPTKSALPNPNGRFYEGLKAKGIPVLFIHAYYHHMDCDYVIVDDVKAAYEACSYLINKGHRKIGGIFKSDDLQGHKRYEGYLNCMIDHGLHINEDHIMWQATEDEHAIFNNKMLLKDFVSRLKGCSALVCYNDEFAIDLMEELEQEALQVPDDISIVAFDNTKLGDNYKVSITSMDHPKAYLGQHAGRQLLRMIEGEKGIQEALEVSIHEKSSVKALQS